VGGPAPRVRRRARAGSGAIGRDRTRRVADGCIVRAPCGKQGGPGGAHATGRTPTDRGEPGTKRHRLTEGRGIPAAVQIAGADRHDGTELAALLDAQVIEPAPTAPPPLATARGDTVRIPPEARAPRPIPPPGHPDRHPRRRRVAEATHARFDRVRRVPIRRAKHGTTSLGFVQSAACPITYRTVRPARAPSG
jgi:hypothetical protein